MIAEKNSEWTEICEKFNAKNGVHQRNITQLKALWRNLKSRTKTAVAKDRREKKKTGGGPPYLDLTIDKFSNTIMEMLPQQIESLENPLDDDDASFHADVKDVQESSEDENNNAIISIKGPPANETQKSTSVQCPTKQSDIVACADSGAGTSTSTVSRTHSPSVQCNKRKYPMAMGRQDLVKSRMLEMAEIEHEKKMKVLQRKEDVLTLKKRKLEAELCRMNHNENKATGAESSNSSSVMFQENVVGGSGIQENVNATNLPLWHPFF